MTIEWFGHTCIRLITSSVTIVVDPPEPASGLKLSKMSADVLLVTNGGVDPSAVSGKPFLINGPGEYEIKNTFVYGLPVGRNLHERLTIYLLESEGISCAHLGNLGHQLANAELERLEGVDVLFIPVGGHDVLDAKAASEAISAIEPRIVIPTQYRLPGLKKTLDPVSAFAKELGVKESATLPKLKLNKKDLPQDDMRVVVLSP
ncbi:MAG: MBL fold metallo-hydrolase [Candidatus Kerfeldbacteria bacterium]|nr:MBL fold metallo-hydrolase [Candidatus Kerfeldbacteria bacterium]